MPKDDNSSSDFFMQVAGAEMAPQNHTHHPSRDDLLALLSDDVANEKRSRLHAHLATCENCRSEWKTLQASLSEEHLSLEERSVAPTFVSAVRERHPATALTTERWFKKLLESRTLVAASAAAIALALTFAVMIPVLHSSSRQTQLRLESISNDLAALQDDIGFSTLLPNSLSIGTITEAALQSYDWRALRPYTVQPDDTWKTIASIELNDESLWPAVWVLNAQISTSGSLEAGRTIQLPTSLEN